MGPRGSSFEPAHGQELEDALLHVLEAEVVALEDGARLREVHARAARQGPGQVEDPGHVGARDVVLAAGRRHGGHAVELAPDRLARLVGQVGGRHALAQVGHLGLAVALHAELAADGLELRAQDVLALARVEVGARLLHDVGLDLGLGERLLQRLLDEPQALAHVLGADDAPLDGHREAQVRADQVGEAPPAGDVHAQHVHHLGRVAAVALDQRVHHLHATVDEAVDVGALGLTVLDRLHAQREEGLGAHDVQQPDAPAGPGRPPARCRWACACDGSRGTPRPRAGAPPS